MKDLFFLSVTLSIFFSLSLTAFHHPFQLAFLRNICLARSYRVTLKVSVPVVTVQLFLIQTTGSRGQLRT